MDQKSKDWLSAESGKWVADGIITQEQREEIELRYPVQKANNPLLIFFAVIGSLLIGAGIILVFATNWWALPIGVRVALAFTPLLLAQGICLYTYSKQYSSVPFCEGSAVFLSLSFFAALALIGQVFHMPSDLHSFILVCVLCSLPAAYLFRARSVITIYVLGSMYVASYHSVWVFPALLVLCLPFFYRELTGTASLRVHNYLLLLLSLMLSRVVPVIGSYELSIIEAAMLCGLAMLLVDALYRWIAPIYSLTTAKLLAIATITTTVLLALVDFGYSDKLSVTALVITAVIAAMYLALRCITFTGIAASDIFFATAVVLMLSANIAGVVACLLAVALGVYYMVRGSKTLELSNLNYGMVLVLLVIAIRFFDYSMGLLARGVVFILLGVAFLGINLYISHKRKELQV